MIHLKKSIYRKIIRIISPIMPVILTVFEVSQQNQEVSSRPLFSPENDVVAFSFQGPHSIQRHFVENTQQVTHRTYFLRIDCDLP